jgi:hypothetical protein
MGRILKNNIGTKRKIEKIYRESTGVLLEIILGSIKKKKSKWIS